MNIQDFIQHATNNRSKIFPDTKVSCYYCCTTYLGKYITEWTADDCAICPCGIDSVVPFEVDYKTLQEASKYYFCDEGELTKEEYDNNLEKIVETIPGVNFIKG